MENNIKLSIIVPVYKTEKYLRKCLSSIFDQDVDRSLYEVIIVNDGSPDDSQEIIDDFCATYDNASCLVQENQGLSMARNNGVGVARGEYIWFVDSDDWVEHYSINYILCQCQYAPDLISIAKIQGVASKNNGAPYTISGKDILLNGGFEHGAVYYIYKKEFLKLNALKFVAGIYHEDSEFTPRSLYFAEKIRVIPTPIYNVYENMESITRTVNPKKSYDLLIVAQNLLHFRDCNVVEPPIKDIFDRLISIIINNALANIVKSSRIEQKKFDRRMGSHKDVLLVLSRSTLKYRVEYCLFKLLPNNYTLVYRMLKTI